MTAIIGSAIAVVAVAAAITALAFALRNAERSAADARVDAATTRGQLAIALADVTTWRNTAARERTRADGLDDVLDEVALNGDTDGARARVLARMREEVPDADDDDDRPAGADREGVVVPDPGTAVVAGREGEGAVAGG